MRFDIRSGIAEVIQLSASLQILAIVWNRELKAAFAMLVAQQM